MNQESGSTQPSSQPLLLPSLLVQGFRAFRDLRIPNLGRVNLIVGKNNVGKTTLLEALKLYASGVNAPREIRSILARRQEFQRSPSADEKETPFATQRIFFSSQTSPPIARRTIKLGPLSSVSEQLAVMLGWRRSIRDQEGRLSTSFSMEDEFLNVEEDDVREVFIVEHGERPIRSVLLSRLWEIRFQDSEDLVTCHYVSARGLGQEEIGRLWDSIVLTDQERDVLSALQLIAPEIERISLIDTPLRYARERLALVLKTNAQAPEPLPSLGDGMNRIFELALGLVSARKGIFLADEFENGVHYSVQEDVWRFIFETATRLNVQVFATTHSWDCIQAFQRAASAHKEEGALIRLERHQEDVRATVFNERKLEILTRESIEVR